MTASQTSATAAMSWLLRRTATPSAARLTEDVAHLARPGWIEARRRLVEQKQPRAREQRRGQSQTLAHPRREPANPPVGRLPVEPDELEEVVHLRLRAASIERREELERPPRGQVRIEPRFLDEARHVVQANRKSRLSAEKLHPAGIGADQTEQ